MQPATTDESQHAPEPAVEPATAPITDPTTEPARECGWFGSSHELREGLEVMELSIGLLGAVWKEQALELGASAE
ncbi:MAG TPA: hypothetical protein VK195_15630 [Burkholderiaceae bacterium]|nr:hypothetical protein [Burkholderiaceae bacterium]